MKKYLFIFMSFLFAACTKEVSYRDTSFVNGSEKTISLSKKNNKHENCNFGFQARQYNDKKRTMTADLQAASSKIRGPKNPRGPKGGGGGTDTTGNNDGGGTNPQPPTTYSAVILLDFNGHYYPGGYWSSKPLNLGYSGMNESEIQRTFDAVTEDYAPFGVTVTTDEAIYNAAPANLRMRVVITESSEWYGRAGGVAYLNSFTWGNNEPCFVFSALLGYSAKYVWEAASHEAGHTLGLRHQIRLNPDGTTAESYHSGDGSGEISWAPIMGVGYYRNLTTWHNGPIYAGTNQDDIAVMSQTIPLRGDDAGATLQTARVIASGAQGLIQNTSDVDMLKLTTGVSGLVTVQPHTVSAQLDLLVQVYDAYGNLVATVNDPMLITAAAQLNPNTQYYISVTTAANPYASTYGQIGTYTVTAN